MKDITKTEFFKAHIGQDFKLLPFERTITCKIDEVNEEYNAIVSDDRSYDIEQAYLCVPFGFSYNGLDMGELIKRDWIYIKN
jgi:hypothetical protein